MLLTVLPCIAGALPPFDPPRELAPGGRSDSLFGAGEVHVASDGAGWVVLWDDTRSGGSSGGSRLYVRSYAASAAQFQAWGEDLLAAEFRLMAAAEDDHARRIRELLAGLHAAPV